MSVTPTRIPGFTLRPATPGDVTLLVELIRELADYERHQAKASEADLQRWLFGPRPVVEAIIGEQAGQPMAFALFFHNFSTFLGKPGIYLEDIYVRPELRGQGVGRAIFAYLARLARQRDCGRLEWSVLNWNLAAIRFYEGLGARPNEQWTTYRLTRDGIDELAGIP